MMALEPKIFMFDEPTAGMSVDEVPVVLDLIARLKTGQEQDHPAGRAQDGRGALARRPHHRAAQRPACRRRRARGGDRLADRAGSLSRLGPGKSAHERSAHACRACTPISAAITSCRASTSTRRQGQTTMLLGRNGAGKTTTLRTIMGLWRASNGQHRARRRRHREPAPRATSRASASAMRRRRWRCSPISRSRKTSCSAARDGPLDDTRLDWIFGFFPALKTILAVARRRAVRRTEADAVDRPRHRRAARAAADRRADQGPRARDRRLADRLPQRDQGDAASPSSWSSRISASRAKSATRFASWTTAASSIAAGWLSSPPTTRLQDRLLGLSLDAHQ